MNMPNTDSGFAVRYSKLYTLAQTHKFLDHWEPEIDSKMIVESIIDEDYPRNDVTDVSTRIFMDYRNTLSDRSTLYLIPDTERLDRSFTLDDFLEGYKAQIEEAAKLDDPLQQLNYLLAEALHFCVISILGLNPQEVPKSTKPLCTKVLASIITALFDDPLDVVLCVVENIEEGQHQGDPKITALWKIKTRPDSFTGTMQELVEADNIQPNA